MSADLLRFRIRVEGGAGFLDPANFEAYGWHPLGTRQDTVRSRNTDPGWLVQRVFTQAVTTAGM